MNTPKDSAVEKNSAFSSSKVLSIKLIDRLEKLAASPGMITGVPTGYSCLDQSTAGLQPSEFIIVAARPTMGKTAFALSIAMNAAVDNSIPVCVFSLDMSKEHLMTRMLGMKARVKLSRLHCPCALCDEEWMQLSHAVTALSNAPFFIDDTSALSTMELCARIRRIKAEHNIGLVIVDSLQQLMQPNQPLHELLPLEISDIPRALKILAKEIKTPIMVLSQLSRKVDKRAYGFNYPTFADLLDSGTIEQYADVILFIYRDDYYKYQKPSERPLVGNAEIIIGKNRNGPLAVVELAYHSAYTTFEEKDF